MEIVIGILNSKALVIDGNSYWKSSSIYWKVKTKTAYCSRVSSLYYFDITQTQMLLLTLFYDPIGSIS
jgi:hypothetical protein